MREIKFRAWDKTRNRFHWGNGNVMLTMGGVIMWQFAYDPPTPVNQDDFVVEQFTGLRDKNGKEIYEGDIITCYAVQREINDVIEKDQKVVVEYHDGYFYPFGYNCGWRSGVDDIEVIGNIHQSPELLEAKP